MSDQHQNYDSQPTPAGTPLHSDQTRNFNAVSGNYGSFLERLIAALVDGIIVAIPVYFISSMFPADTVNNTEGFSSISYGYNPTNNLLSVLIGWLYYALQESGPRQATIGKKLMNLKVTNLNGGRISFINATGRHFAKILSAIILLIGYFMMLFNDKKQTLHDKLAGTLVVKRS